MDEKKIFEMLKRERDEWMRDRNRPLVRAKSEPIVVKRRLAPRRAGV